MGVHQITFCLNVAQEKSTWLGGFGFGWWWCAQSSEDFLAVAAATAMEENASSAIWVSCFLWLVGMHDFVPTSSHLECACIMFPFSCVFPSASKHIPRVLRLDVILQDPSRQNPLYVGKWHVFLPSDLLLGYVLLTCSCGIGCFSGLNGLHWCRLEVCFDLSLWLELIQKAIHWAWWCAIVAIMIVCMLEICICEPWAIQCVHEGHLSKSHVMDLGAGILLELCQTWRWVLPTSCFVIAWFLALLWIFWLVYQRFVGDAFEFLRCVFPFGLEVEDTC